MVTILCQALVSSLLLLSIFKYSFGCHPECTWQCDDPVCPADCTIHAGPLNCTVMCSDNGHYCYPPRCTHECLDNVCETDMCPICSILCEAPRCRFVPLGVRCETMCSQGMFSWSCKKPKNCPYPKCELMCEKPACETTNSGIKTQINSFQLHEMIFLIVFIIFIG